MRNIIKRIIALGFILVSTQVLAQNWEWATDFPVGASIPPISAADQNGSLHTLNDLTGEKGLVLVFSRSFDWCPYCIAQLQQLVDVAPEFEAMGINVATMTYDSLETLKGAEVDYGTTFPLLHDEGTQHFSALNILNDQYEPGERAYGIPYPGILLLSPEGTVLAKFAEEDYRERPDFELVLRAAEAL